MSLEGADVQRVFACLGHGLKHLQVSMVAFLRDTQTRNPLWPPRSLCPPKKEARPPGPQRLLFSASACSDLAHVLEQLAQVPDDHAVAMSSQICKRKARGRLLPTRRGRCGHTFSSVSVSVCPSSLCTHLPTNLSSFLSIKSCCHHVIIYS